MIHLLSLEISLLLKGRTRTATFTDDMLVLKEKVKIVSSKQFYWCLLYDRGKRLEVTRVTRGNHCFLLNIPDTPPAFKLQAKNFDDLNLHQRNYAGTQTLIHCWVNSNQWFMQSMCTLIICICISIMIRSILWGPRCFSDIKKKGLDRILG